MLTVAARPGVELGLGRLAPMVAKHFDCKLDIVQGELRAKDIVPAPPKGNVRAARAPQRAVAAVVAAVPHPGARCPLPLPPPLPRRTCVSSSLPPPFYTA